MKHPRGQTVATNRPVRIGKALVLGTKSRLLVWVKTGKQRWRNEFANLCCQLGLDAIVAQDNGDGCYAWETVYDVAGTEESLRELFYASCVNKCENVLNSHIQQNRQQFTAYGQSIDSQLCELRAAMSR